MRYDKLYLTSTSTSRITGVLFWAICLEVTRPCWYVLWGTWWWIYINNWASIYRRQRYRFWHVILLPIRWLESNYLNSSYLNTVQSYLLLILMSIEYTMSYTDHLFKTNLVCIFTVTGKNQPNKPRIKKLIHCLSPHIYIIGKMLIAYCCFEWNKNGKRWRRIEKEKKNWHVDKKEVTWRGI